ncbi:hypothetical protein JOF56_008999 [Kibdelosporangium banguiense]|uniref:Lipoprotein n=1 Tax=Kibdelosporangium banguiense TaxID=1365924 RepID=A0ABS4TX98_9PSEU|nr:hypothetical protein [Kibdelosporangium banguiense]MBP2328614.1 hypothetical protein [Kibdelosporangium banguiense]
MIARHAALVFCAALALTGCTSATNDQPSQKTTTTTTTGPATTVSIRPECVNVADKAHALLTQIGRLTTGDATPDQVRAAAGELSDAFDDAKATVGPDTRAHLDKAGQALRRVQDALNAQPIDTASLRAATNDLVAALGDVAAICAPSSSTTATVTTAPTS